PTGSLVARFKWTGDAGENRIDWPEFPPLDADSGIADFGEVAEADAGFVPLDVKVDGGKVSVAAFGMGLYMYKDPSPLQRGHIGLQFREGPIAFRNIRLRPLILEPMLNGRDLAGWNADQARASKFEVKHGELHVAGGSGQLETDASYDDFTLQFDCRVDGDSLNSGVFFRCIPRQYMQGYECQISNKPAEGDPTQPA